MDWKDPKIWLGAGAVGVVGYLLLRSPGGGESYTQPSLISYVSPGSPDAVIDGTASGNSTSPISSGQALIDTTRSSNDTYLSAANTESLLASVQGLVASQVGKLNFSTDYGFASQITGGLTLDDVGSPQFNITTRFTPNDPSNAQRQITNLTTARNRLSSNLTAAREQIADLRTRLRTTVRPPATRPASSRPVTNTPRPVSPPVTSFPRP